MNKKKMLIIGGIILAVIAVVALVLFLVFRTHKVTKLEEMKIRENSNEVISYVYNITDNDFDDLEKYLLYAIDYYRYEKGNNSVSMNDITKIIKEVFNKEYSEDDILKLGITSEMVNRNIMYDYQMNSFNISNDKITKKEIADTELKFYKIDEIRKRGSKYFVTYTEYTIDNPYKILNYYNDLTEEERSNSIVYNDKGEVVVVEAPVDPYETSDIIDYLNGSKSRKVLYDYISDELLTKVGETTNKLKVTYVINGEKIIIDKIETE